MTERELMKQALITYFLPELREIGFEGSFPNYRRITEQKTDLLSIVFDKWGGSFAIEISYAYLSEEPNNLLSAQDYLHPGELTVYKTHNRKRLPADGEWIHFCDQIHIKSQEGDKIYFLTESQKQAFLKNIPKENFMVETAGEGIYCRSAAVAVKLLKVAEQWWDEHMPNTLPETAAIYEEIPKRIAEEPEKRWGFFKLIQGGKGRKKQ